MNFASILIGLLVWAAGCAQAPPSRPPAPPKVVFIGDSVTYLWSQPNFGLSFWSTYPTWNDQGLIGENSWQLQQRFSADVVAQHPAVAHILTGTNDVFSVYRPPWQIDGGSPLYNTTYNIKLMVALAQAANIKVVLGTIPPYGCTDTAQCALAVDSEPSLSTHWKNIDALNTWIRQYGFENGITIADYWQALVERNGAGVGEMYSVELTHDGVHPSELGYALMTPLAEAAITQAVSQGKQN